MKGRKQSPAAQKAARRNWLIRGVRGVYHFAAELGYKETAVSQDMSQVMDICDNILRRMGAELESERRVRQGKIPCSIEPQSQGSAKT